MPELHDNDGELYAIAKYEDQLLVGGEEKAVERWAYQLGTWKKIGTLAKIEGEVNDIKISPDQNFALIVGECQFPFVYDFKSISLRKVEKGHKSGIVSCGWSPDSELFFTSGKDGILNLYDKDRNLKKSFNIGGEIRDNLVRNQACFGPDNILYLPGSENLKYVKDNEIQVTKINEKSKISMIEMMNDNIIILISDTKISFYDIKSQNKIESFEAENKILDVSLIDKTIYILDEDGNLCKISSNFDTKIRNENQKSSGAMEEEEIPVVEEKPKKLDLNKFRVDEVEEEDDNIVGKVVKVENIEENLAPVYKNNKNEKRELHEKYQEIKKINSPVIEEEVYTRRKYIPVEEEDIDFEMNHHIEDEEEEEDDEEDKEIFKIDYTKKNDSRGLLSLINHPQGPIYVGSTNLTGSRNYLAWNMCGKVVIRKHADIDSRIEEYIDIEYTLGSLSKKSVLNSSAYSMADINFKGTLLASEGYILREDEYEDEELGEEMKKAKIRFFPSKNDKVGWEHKLSAKENIISIAQGSLFSCVFTSKNFIRFFSPEGKEFFILGARGVISMAGYDNVLAFIYHGTTPFSGDQCLYLKVFNTSNLKVVVHAPVILSNKSKVKWFGFSSQGNIFIQDTHHVLWTLFDKESWSPILEKNLWMVGIDDNKVYGVKLGYDETEPNPLADHIPKQYDIEIPFSTPDYNKLGFQIIQNEHIEFRSDVWGHMAHCLVQNPEDNERTRMPDQKACDKERQKLEKELVNLCRLNLLNGNEDEALWLALQIRDETIFEACCKLITKMNKPSFLERLRDTYQKLGAKYFQDKEKGYFNLMPFRDITEKDKKLELELNALKNQQMYDDKYGSQNKLVNKSFKEFNSQLKRERAALDGEMNQEKGVSFFLIILAFRIKKVK